MYKSPFHYFPPASQQQEFGPLEIQRAKKRILAEAELKGNDSNSRASANELLQWLDNIKPEELRYHHVIFKNKPLLQFLEEGIIAKESCHLQFAESTSEPALQNFVSALIQKQYDFYFAEAFRNKDLEKIRELSKFQLPDLDKKGRYYYAATTSQLSAYYHQLLQITRNWAPQHEQQLLDFLRLPLFDLLRALPPYFQPMRQEFANLLLEFSRVLKNEDNQRADLAKKVLAAAGQIDKSYLAQIDNKRTLKPPQASTTVDNPGQVKKIGCLVYWLFVAAFILVKLIALLGG